MREDVEPDARQLATCSRTLDIQSCRPRSELYAPFWRHKSFAPLMNGI